MSQDFGYNAQTFLTSKGTDASDTPQVLAVIMMLDFPFQLGAILICLL